MLKMERQVQVQDCLSLSSSQDSASVTLEEDEYLNEMGQIIQRDFFPQLNHYKALDKSLDYQSNRIQFQASSPDTFETPRQPSSSTTTAPLAEFKKPSLTLNQFCRVVKNRENENFKKTLAKTEEKRKEGKTWMYEVPDTDTKERLIVPSMEEQAKGKERPLQVDTWAYTVHNPLMFHPQGVSQEENYDREKQQEIVYANTCFKNEPFNEKQNQDLIQKLAMNQYQNLLFEEKIGIDGKIVTPKPLNSLYSYVQSTPSPRPGYGASPLMTYGQINSTPVRLERDSPHTGSRFSLAPVPRREIIAMQLEKASSNKTKSQRTPKNEWKLNERTPKHIFSDLTPKTPKEKVLMSLLRKGAPPSPWDRPKSDTKCLRGSRSPSVSSLGISFKPKTCSSEIERGTNKDMTDNLLQLPTGKGPHQQASDLAQEAKKI